MKEQGEITHEQEGKKKPTRFMWFTLWDTCTGESLKEIFHESRD